MFETPMLLVFCFKPPSVCTVDSSAIVHIRDIKVLEKSASDLSEEFARGNFAVAKSRNRFSVMAMDQNLEQCNATVKGRGGTVTMIQKEESMRRSEDG